MTRRLAAIGAACALAALPTGCTTPPSHLYTLNQTATVAAKSDANSSALYVVVGPVSIPPSVDLPQIVVRTTPNEVRVDEFNRWAAPLQSNISHVVAGNLVTLLGTPASGYTSNPKTRTPITAWPSTCKPSNRFRARRRP